MHVHVDMLIKIVAKTIDEVNNIFGRNVIDLFLFTLKLKTVRI